MNIDDSLKWLFNVRRFGPNRTLEPTRKYLELMGNPQNSFRSIHIGGTNGKGSTSAMIASILEAGNYKVGLFTSPHLERFNERIKINGREISNDDASRLLTYAKSLFEEMQSYTEPMSLHFFDILTGVCFKYFEEKSVDFGIIEVGLGGRLDATNIITPLISVITNIGYEHVNILGPTLEDIAFEKAAIIKKNVPIVTGENKLNVLKVFLEASEKSNSELIAVENYTIYKRLNSSSDGQRFYLKTKRNYYSELQIPLLGLHQVINAATAITVIETLQKNGISIPQKSIENGLKNVYWPGRLEIIHKEPMIVLDCAKDEEATEMVKKTIKDDLDKRRIIAVVSISSDKNIEGMIKNISDIAEYFILTKHSVTYRAADPERLIHEIQKYGKPYDVVLEREDAFKQALEAANPNDMILVIGSVYLAGDARTFYSNLYSGFQ
jgi:dihydrofolate synthase/folylpolyglutamate synthase